MEKDQTFRNYKPEQAQSYAKARPPYSDNLYKLIFDHHAKTDGKVGRVVDVGCGPGLATRSLAQAFDEAIGLDPGAEMINAARSIGGKTKSGKDIRYEVSAAEACSKVDGLEPGSVDMLTSATAVHWFEMDKFWHEAATLLNPGGTVAVWTSGLFYVHPFTPNAAEIQRIQSRLEEELGPYELEGNRLSKEFYDNLPLPWQISSPVEEFPESLYTRHEFNRDGVVPEGEEFFSGNKDASLEYVEKTLSTASMVTRWREANPDIAGTEQDCLKRAIKDWRAALGGKDKFIGGTGTVILLFKKKS